MILTPSVSVFACGDSPGRSRIVGHLEDFRRLSVAQEAHREDLAHHFSIQGRGLRLPDVILRFPERLGDPGRVRNRVDIPEASWESTKHWRRDLSCELF